MKKLAIILVTGILMLFFSSPILASDGVDSTTGGVSTMLEAIEHAEAAKSHKAHADHIHEHAKKSLALVKKAEIEAYESGNNEGKEYITESIQHLIKAIKHADQGHARIANEHVEDALIAMYKFSGR